MTKLTYATADKISLKSNPDFNEKWVQEIIAENTNLLGLGELELIAKEKIQERAGRLDLLFADAEGNTRYEVELMLGKTDESHIIRCIEYWDIERRRYPGYEHIAVIIAEDITSRFLNVLSLFSGTIPLIGIQLNALSVDNKIILNFVKVLDQTLLRMDDTTVEASPTVDRSFWENKKSTPKMVQYADKLLDVLNRKSDKDFELNYVKSYIGLKEGNISRGFVRFRPRKSHIKLMIYISDKNIWLERLDELLINSSVSSSKHFIELVVNPKNIGDHQSIIDELLEAAVREFEG